MIITPATVATVENDSVTIFPFRKSVNERGLTSVTPGRPDNRTLGVQLPHSLSDPRTSPLRTPRRSGEYVQFDSRREQLPFERTRGDQHPTILSNGTRVRPEDLDPRRE